MLERRDTITNEVLEPTTFVLAYPTAFVCVCVYNVNFDIQILILCFRASQYKSNETPT